MEIQGNKQVEDAAISFVMDYERSRGRTPRDSRYRGAPADVESSGRIIEVNCGFLHSSDLNPDKPINWKRMIEMNGEYGCLGDLGMHALHVPLRAGWKPLRVFAHLNKIVSERPDGKGGMAPCKTWDNGSLYVDTVNPFDGLPFPTGVTIFVSIVAAGLPVALSYGAMGLEFSVGEFASAAWRYWREPRRYLPGPGESVTGYVVQLVAARGQIEVARREQHAREGEPLWDV